MHKHRFEGWYFRHQQGDNVIAFIPGQAESGAFLQVITSFGARQFTLPGLSVGSGIIRSEGCTFSREGCRLDLPGLRGEIAYGPLRPLSYDIMGPFRFLPMECRHGVISMAHTLCGSISLDGQIIDLTGGQGYIEKDSGTSFPAAYQWVQCNDFPQPCALMAAVARIPVCGTHFTGCICAAIHSGREYRLATYTGAHILAADARHIRLAQGRLLLEIDMNPRDDGHALLAPVHGRMCGWIREGSCAEVRARLFSHGRMVFDLHSTHAAYEYVPEIVPGLPLKNV